MGNNSAEEKLHGRQLNPRTWVTRWGTDQTSCAPAARHRGGHGSLSRSSCQKRRTAGTRDTSGWATARRTADLQPSPTSTSQTETEDLTVQVQEGQGDGTPKTKRDPGFHSAEKRVTGLTHKVSPRSTSKTLRPEHWPVLMSCHWHQPWGYIRESASGGQGASCLQLAEGSRATHDVNMNTRRGGSEHRKTVTRAEPGATEASC